MIKSSRELTYAEALYEAVDQEMSVDPNVFVMGLGVNDHIGMYGTTKNLHLKYGENRNFDTPISEDGMTGFAIGAAIAGLRPIHVHQRMDFLLLCMNQLINIGAKTSYLYDGKFSVPLVVRAIIGRSWGQGAQHSQSFHSYFMHVPGVKVVAPTTPHDAKGCLISAIRDNNPVIFVEHRMLYGNKGIVPEDSYLMPFGKARILTSGIQITIVAISHMVVEALRAEKLLKQIGISAEVIDPVSLSPLDMETIISSVSKTKKLLVVDNSWVIAGAGAEIVAGVCEGIPEFSGIKVRRMGYANTSCPTTRVLEDLFYPSSEKIAKVAYAMVSNKIKDWEPEKIIAKEIDEFKGPF
jgi:pyruvate dehydrogenase E1 component beta subunit